MTSLSRVFIGNKFMAIVFAVGLAVSILFTSTITLSTIYLEESIERALGTLDRHMVLSFISGKNETPMDMLSNVKKILENTDEIEDIGCLIYAAKYQLKDEINVSISTYNASLTLPKDTMFIIITIDKSPITLQPVLYVSTRIIEYNMNMNKNFTVSPNALEESVVYGELFNKTIQVTLYKEFYRSPFAELWRDYTSYIDPDGLFQAPYTSEYYVVLLTPINDLESIWNDINSHVEIITGLYFGGYWIEERFYNIGLEPREADELISAYRYAKDNGYAVVFVGYRYELKKVVFGYSIDASIRKIGETIYNIGMDAIGHGYAILIMNYELVSALQQARFQEMFMRFSTIIGMLPSFIVVWIIASRLPPVVISVMRKIIALIRIRGVSIGSLKRAFAVSVVVWSIVGLAIGIVVGPIYALVLKKISLMEAPRYIECVIQDIYTLIGLGVIAIIAIVLSIRKSFSVLSRVAPREFTRPTILAELPMIEKGMGTGSWIILVLGIYYVVKTAIGFSPMLYMMTHHPESPVLVILLIILAILDPIVSFLGPIFFIYGVAKLLVAYPGKMTKIVNAIVAPFVGELKNLVSRLLEVKPARITVAIMMIGFAVGVLMQGIIGAYSTEQTMNTIRDVAYGTDYYIYKGFNTTYFLEHKDSIVENATKFVEGEYSLIYIVGVRVGDLYVGDQKINYIIFIDKNSFTKIFRTPNVLGVDANAIDLLSSLDSGKAIFIVGTQGKSIEDSNYKIVYKKSVWDVGEEICSIKIIGNMYNLPGSLVFNSLSAAAKWGYAMVSETKFGIMPGAYIPTPTIEPFLVMSINDVDKVVNKINSTVREETVYAEGAKEKMPWAAGVAVIVATNHIDDEEKIKNAGWRIYDATARKKGVENAKEFFMLGVRQSVSAGLALYTTSLIAIAILAYSSIYENLYAFTLLRARGVKSSRVMKMALAEGLTISMLGVIPGIILGVVLGYNAVRSFLYLSALPELQNINKMYGIGFLVEPTLEILLPTIGIPLFIIVLSLVISYVTYKKVLREALVVLGSHI
ncbi:hypothetical protein J4526_05755 [Desulfurococcaceae archaeon MEX13E-LK6-19]|nr:hypothetical protein J4526_05755 [Desulfurococcaceae archaeon MEX13E-LK6-19]